MPCTFFMYTYMRLPTLCAKTIVTLLLECFHVSMCKTPQQPCIFLPPLKIDMPCHLEAYSTWPPKIFSAPSHCPHFWPLLSLWQICCCLEPQFPFFYASLMALLWIPDRYASLLCHSSLTFLVYCCFSCLQLFSFLDRFSPIPPMPTKFH